MPEADIAPLFDHLIGAAASTDIVRKLVERDLDAMGVRASKHQPDTNQTHRGTVIHRRWEGSRAAALAQNDSLSIVVQREPDEYDDETERPPHGSLTEIPSGVLIRRKR